MKSSLAEQLAGIKLDFSTYSKLPIREDVLIFDDAKPGDKDKKPILAQWEKLHYLRNHLERLNRYLQKNNGETIRDWMVANNTGLSKNVLDKIGSHNNKTGGISAYFFNLQNFYDQEEQKYDDMEANAKMPNDLIGLIGELRKKRFEKRNERRAVRKIKLRDMKADGKGYLEIAVEEPAVVQAANAEAEKAVEATVAAVKKTTSKVAIWIAGAVIVVAGIAFYVNSKSEKVAA